MLNLPTEVNEKGEVIREGKDLCIDSIYDEYDQSEVNLRSLLDRVFYTNGRIRPHERILCWFPKYLQLYLDALEELYH